MLTVYSKPNCIQCTYTTNLLDELGIPYEKRDVTQDEEALMAVRRAGYQAVPVVVTEEGYHWYGFRPEKIKGLLEGKIIL